MKTHISDRNFRDYLAIVIIYLRLNLINHFVGFIPCQFAYNSAFRNLVFRWESCKGSVWKSVKECKEKLKSVHSSRASWLDLTTGELPKEAYVWSMQGSWRVTPAGALQDKTSRLARQLARDLNSWLVLVASSSSRLIVRIPYSPYYKYLIPMKCRELPERILREKP